jgi:uncharacterized metal-binding protein
MSIIFVVMLRMSMALGYEFDECATRVEFESAVVLNLLENNISVFIFCCKKSLNKDFHLFKIFTSMTSTIFDDIFTTPISAAILL